MDTGFHRAPLRSCLLKLVSKLWIQIKLSVLDICLKLSESKQEAILESQYIGINYQSEILQ